MPARNPRVQVVVPEEVFRDLARIARYSNASMSSIVGKMIEEAHPILHQLADALEEAHGLSMQLPGSLTAKLDALGRAAQELEHGTQELLDGIQEQAADHREKQGEKRRKRPASQGTTL